MSDSKKQNISERIALLRRELEEHNRRYYVEAEPLVSDNEYDRLFSELAGLEAQHPVFADADSPTQRVGGAPLKEFKKVKYAELADIDDDDNSLLEKCNILYNENKEISGKFFDILVEETYV